MDNRQRDFVSVVCLTRSLRFASGRYCDEWRGDHVIIRRYLALIAVGILVAYVVIRFAGGTLWDPCAAARSRSAFRGGSGYLAWGRSLGG